MGIAGYHGTMYYFPNYVYHKFKTKSEAQRGNHPNAIFPILAPDENSRMVVKPNPDFAYGSGFYDLKDGPIRMRGVMPDSTYWSIALYQPNTINYYVKNDLQYGKPNFDLVIGRSDPKIDNTEFVYSPTSEGFILLRLLVIDKSKANLDKVEAYLKGIDIEVITDKS